MSSRYFDELTVKVLPQLSSIPANKHLRSVRGNWICGHIVSEVSNNNKEWGESADCEPGYPRREGAG